MLINKLLTSAAQHYFRRWSPFLSLLPSPAAHCSSLPPQQTSAMELGKVVEKLEELAPTSLAEEWDNVGLLVEPSLPHLVNTILLTNDLTEAVVKEARELATRGEKVDMIVSYHPPIFKPLKRLTQCSAKERIVVWALEERVAIYSPHTAYDSVWGGVNDWLVAAVGEGEVTPLRVSQLSGKLPHTLVVQGSEGEEEKKVEEVIRGIASGAGPLVTTRASPGSVWSKEVAVSSSILSALATDLPRALPGCSITVRPSPKVLSAGPGRLLVLPSSKPLQSVIEDIKQHLKLPHIRLALPHTSSLDHPVSRVAVCAGSGGSLLRGVAADLYLTGEMSHHDLLEANAAGIAVLLTEHSNSERGFLRVVKETLEEKLREAGAVKIMVSSADHDPVCVV